MAVHNEWKSANKICPIFGRITNITGNMNKLIQKLQDFWKVDHLDPF